MRTSFDPGSRLYTYSYAIESRPESRQNVADFTLETGAPVAKATSPRGWTFLATNFEGRAYLSWVADEIELPPDFVDDGNVVEGAYSIKPGQTLAGFSFQSFLEPRRAAVTWYAEGFTKMPAADDAGDFEGYDPALFHFTTNSLKGKITAPVAQCGDGIDNDGDAVADLSDPGCRGPTHPYESPACDDGIDNDGDGRTDHPADPDCNGRHDPSEVADCGDSLDSDLDTRVDFPSDGGCNDRADPTEEPDCYDGRDNDGDGHVDYPEDPSCPGPASQWEAPGCDDGADNDGDGRSNFPGDPECNDRYDLSETPDCGDGVDNDGDGPIDLEDDGCPDPDNLDEER